MEAASSVNQNDINTAGFGCRQTIEDHGGGIGAMPMSDDIHADTSAPHFELFNGCCAKGITGNQQCFFSLLRKPLRKLGKSRSFTYSIGPDRQDNEWTRAAFNQAFERFCLTGLEHI
jgi:hypothetical protein